MIFIIKYYFSLNFNENLKKNVLLRLIHITQILNQ